MTSRPAGARRSQLLLALTGAVAARAALAGVTTLAARPVGAPWRRTNYAGRPVTLLGGPALALSATATAVLGAPAGTRSAAALVGAVAGLVGGYDDLAGARPDQARDKGLAGHLRALREGRVSAGAVKVAGIGSAAAAAAVLTRGRAGGARALVDGILTTGLVAGSANLLNLLDLRPGRAAKAFVLLGAGLTIGAWDLDPLWALGLFVAPVLAAGLYDLRERVMLGDAGSNVIGALAGLWLVLTLSTTGLAIAAALLLLITAYGEFRSLNAAIERTPVLRHLDSIGRPHA